MPETWHSVLQLDNQSHCKTALSGGTGKEHGQELGYKIRECTTSEDKSRTGLDIRGGEDKEPKMDWAQSRTRSETGTRVK